MPSCAPSTTSAKIEKKVCTRDWLRHATALLTQIEYPQPQLAAQHLLAHALGCNRLELLAEPEALLDPFQFEAANHLLKRALQHEPLQYIAGECDFMGLSFRVDRRVLIPRPETEILAETALQLMSRMNQNQLAVADVGTGCGCIAVTLARRVPGIRMVATDISPAALQVARQNARRHGLSDRISFLRADLLQGIQPASLDLVVSNPPYIPHFECRKLPPHIRCYEPLIALDGGPGGMEVTARLIEQAARAIKPGGFLLLETDSRQVRAARKLFSQHGFSDVFVVKDLAGRQRVLGGVIRPW